MDGGLCDVSSRLTLIASRIDARTAPALPGQPPAVDRKADLRAPALVRIGADGRGDKRVPLPFQ